MNFFKNKNRLDAAALGALLLADALFLNYNLFRNFDFFNMAPFEDGGWRILCGQKPYVDFILNLGPIHLYLTAFFMALFGAGKYAALAHILLVNSAVTAAVFLAVRRHCPLADAAAAAALAMASFYWSLSHPWYTQSAHLWGLLAMALLVGRLPFSSSKEAWVCAFACGSAAALSFFKPR